MRVPLDGGSTERLPGSGISNSGGGLSENIALSPDGRTIAFVAAFGDPKKGSLDQKVGLVQVGTNSQTPPRLMNADQNATSVVQFTPDGKAVAYAVANGGVDNVWMQPLDGSKGHQVTNFTSGRIISFCWSPSGKFLALVRSESTSDVVLLRDSSAEPK